MLRNRTDYSLLLILPVAFFVISLLSPPAFGQSDEEKTFLLMYFKEEELQVISATRSLKSITRVAENVEVVTKEDIELINAHTLADILNTVNGVQIYFAGASPGSLVSLSIQGSSIEHVVVFIDGVRMNIPNVADVASIPVQMIEKIEVIKGPASSAWGSSLGGVINVITKYPSKRDIGGVLSASYGERNTGDIRAEGSGKKSGFGYYLSAGRLQTDGMRPFEEISNNNLYTKFSYDVSSKTDLGFSFFYNQGKREEGDFSAFDLFFKDRTENLFSTLNLNSSLSDALTLSISVRAARQRFDVETEILSIGESLGVARTDEREYGVSAKMTYKKGVHNLVFGSDYDYRELVTNYLLDVPKLNVFALYANDTISLGKVSITPGIRYDYTDRNEDFFSPSLGITYELAEKTILRGYIARGFNLPNIGDTEVDDIFFRHNPDLGMEKVWSYQAGLESGVMKYVWLKVSAFRHDIRDAIVRVDLDPDEGTWTVMNAEKVRRQGFEIEMKSMKFHNLILAAAAAFVDSKNLTTGEDINERPEYSYDVSLKYDDEKSFRALLRGRYVWWNQSADLNAKYSTFIFDLNLMKTILKTGDHSLEAFLAGHNIFNGSQYPIDIFKNARRWLEAGLRYKF